MEKQYIFFNSPKPFWFCVFCGIVMFFAAIGAAVYLNLAPWQFAIFAFIFSAASIFAAFKMDTKK